MLEELEEQKQAELQARLEKQVGRSVTCKKYLCKTKYCNVHRIQCEDEIIEELKQDKFTYFG